MATFSVLCIKEMFLYCPVSVQLLSRVQLFETPRTAVGQASLSITNSQVYSNSSPSSQWCHPIISSSVISFSSCPQSSQHQGLLKKSVLHIKWPKYWSFSFSISPSSEYSGLISFRMEWLDVLERSPRDPQESSPTSQFKSIISSVLSFLYSPTLTSIHDHWKNHSLD